MGMTRGTALVATIADVVTLTGVQDLANLETGGELTVASLLVSASDAIYDQLESDGVDPTILTNEEVFERAVAWHACALLVVTGQLGLPDGVSPPQNEAGQADPFAWSDPYYMRVKAKQASAQDARRPSEALPAIGNLRRQPLFSPQPYVWKPTPETKTT